MSTSDAYHILGLHPGASKEEITKAYRHLALEHHPDRGGNPEKMVEINVAKDVLLEEGGSHHSEPLDEDDDEESPYDKMEELLNKEMTRFPKKGGWWNPPHNYAINWSLTGLNTWMFVILPLFAEKKAYRPANPERGMPEGIVIDPNWTPVHHDPTHGDTVAANVRNAEMLIRFAKAAHKVEETVKLELQWIETQFGIKIPAGVESKLVKDSLKVATRRWGTDRLRRKKILIPLDGSKSIELGSWD